MQPEKQRAPLGQRRRSLAEIHEGNDSKLATQRAETLAARERLNPVPRHKTNGAQPSKTPESEEKDAENDQKDAGVITPQPLPEGASINNKSNASDTSGNHLNPSPLSDTDDDPGSVFTSYEEADELGNQTPEPATPPQTPGSPSDSKIFPPSSAPTSPTSQPHTPIRQDASRSSASSPSAHTTANTTGASASSSPSAHTTANTSANTTGASVSSNKKPTNKTGESANSSSSDSATDQSSMQDTAELKKTRHRVLNLAYAELHKQYKPALKQKDSNDSLSSRPMESAPEQSQGQGTLPELRNKRLRFISSQELINWFQSNNQGLAFIKHFPGAKENISGADEKQKESEKGDQATLYGLDLYGLTQQQAQEVLTQYCACIKQAQQEDEEILAQALAEYKDKVNSEPQYSELKGTVPFIEKYIKQRALRKFPLVFDEYQTPDTNLNPDSKEQKNTHLNNGLKVKAVNLFEHIIRKKKIEHIKSFPKGSNQKRILAKLNDTVEELSEFINQVQTFCRKFLNLTNEHNNNSGGLNRSAPFNLTAFEEFAAPQLKELDEAKKILESFIQEPNAFGFSSFLSNPSSPSRSRPSSPSRSPLRVMLTPAKNQPPHTPNRKDQNLNQSIRSLGNGSGDLSKVVNSLRQISKSVYDSINGSPNHSASFADDSDDSGVSPRELIASESFSEIIGDTSPIKRAPVTVPGSVPASRPRSDLDAGSRSEGKHGSTAPGSGQAPRARPGSAPASPSPSGQVPVAEEEQDSDAVQEQTKACKYSVCIIIFVLIIVTVCLVSSSQKPKQSELEVELSEYGSSDDPLTLLRTFLFFATVLNVNQGQEVYLNSSTDHATLTPSNESAYIHIPCQLGEEVLPKSALNVTDDQGNSVSLSNPWSYPNCQVPLNATLHLSASRVESSGLFSWMFNATVEGPFTVGVVKITLNGFEMTIRPGDVWSYFRAFCPSDATYLHEDLYANFYRQSTDSFFTPVKIIRDNWVQDHLSCLPTPPPPVAVDLSKVSREDTLTYPIWHFNASLNTTVGQDTYVCFQFDHESMVLSDSASQKAFDVPCEQGTGHLEENIFAYRSSASDCSVEGEAVSVIPNWPANTLSCVPTPVNLSVACELQGDFTMAPNMLCKASADGLVDPNATFALEWASHSLENDVFYKNTWDKATQGFELDGQCLAAGPANSTLTATLDGDLIPVTPRNPSFTCETEKPQLHCDIVNSPSMNPGLGCQATGVGIKDTDKVEIWWESYCWLKTIDQVFTGQQALAGVQVDGQCVALGPCLSSKVSAQLNGQDLPVDLSDSSFICDQTNFLSKGFFSPAIDKAEKNAASSMAEPTWAPLMLFAAAKLLGRWFGGVQNEISRTPQLR